MLCLGLATVQGDPALGAGLCHRRGGLLAPHLPAGVPRRGRRHHLHPGLRHRPERERPAHARAGLYPSPSPRTSRPSGCAVLRRGRRRLSESTSPARPVHLRAAQRGSDPPFPRMDLISCRNVLIYLDPVLQKKVLPVFHYALNPTGYLLLGTSETVARRPHSSRRRQSAQSIYPKRPAAPSCSLVLYQGAAETGEPSGRRRSAAPRRGAAEKRTGSCCARYAPRRLWSTRRRDRPLPRRDRRVPRHSGAASLNLFEMAREAAAGDRRTIQEAREGDGTVRKKHPASPRAASIVRPGPSAAPRTPEKGAFARAVRGGGERETAAGLRQRRPQGATPRRRRARAERELRESTQYLQAVIEAAGSGQRGAAGRERGGPVGQRGAAEHQRGAGDGQGGAPVEQRGAGDGQRGAAGRKVSWSALEYANGIVETVRNPLLILDAGLRVERANRSFYEYFQVTPEETVGKLLYELGEGRVEHTRAAADAGRAPPEGGPRRGPRGRPRLPAGRAVGR